MTILKSWIFNIINLFHSVKDENLKWQQANQGSLAKLKHARVLAEKALEAELTKKSVQLEHDISLLKTKHDAELSMFKTKCKQDVKDYKQYLAALDQLKSSIQASYTHLPEAVAFTIHHHAKYLLNKMWEAEDFEQKMQHEMQLIRFMTTVHEDSRLHLEGATTDDLPERTMNLIRRE
jgi:transposase-like protein